MPRREAEAGRLVGAEREERFRFGVFLRNELSGRLDEYSFGHREAQCTRFVALIEAGIPVAAIGGGERAFRPQIELKGRSLAAGVLDLQREGCIPGQWMRRR